MRRLQSLQNVIYHKKFKEIYNLVFTADLDNVVDDSKWFYPDEYISIIRPLWIICESKILDKRIWIEKNNNEYEIATATLSLKTNTAEYSNSYIRKYFKNQKELVEYLKELLKPCLDENNYNEEEIYERVV